MTTDEFENYVKAVRKIRIKNALLLLFLSAALLFLWLWSGSGMTKEEIAVMDSVKEAQRYLYEKRLEVDSEPIPEDVWNTGLIGLEWSPITTTLGSLEAKRTACDIRWAVVIRRWLEALKISPGDRVAVYCSSSFPGMTLNVLKALESMAISPVLVVSLGASTWGANDPEFTWPTMEKLLRVGGHIKTKALAYTLGGDSELGGGIPEEGISILKVAADSAGIPVVPAGSLEEVIEWKMGLLAGYGVKAVISVGGSEGNLGTDDSILRLAPGLHRSGRGGNGVIGRALDAGYPVIHILNIKSLCAQSGIPYGGPMGNMLYGRRSMAALVIGAVLFIVVMALYKRWQLM